jgi:flagellar hook-basal body complex protein FliE
MNVETIGAIGAAMAGRPPDAGALTAPHSGAHGPAGFASLIAQGLQQVNSQLQVAESGLQGLALGQGGNLHELMIRLEEADLSFRLLMQTRNRLLESWQDIMRMQV